MKKRYGIFLTYSFLLYGACYEDNVPAQIDTFQKKFQQGEVIKLPLFEAFDIENLTMQNGLRLGALFTRNIYRMAKILSRHRSLQEYFSQTISPGIQEENRAIIRQAVESNSLLRELTDIDANSAALELDWLDVFGIDEIALVDFLTSIGTAKRRIVDYNSHFCRARYS